MGRLQEHIVYFKIIRQKETTMLRGLLYLEENRQPTVEDFAQCLRESGHNVRIENEKEFIFRATDESGNEYLIDILENYQKSNRDRQAENLAGSFMKQDPLL
ncbi:hypothetical protein [Paenibacillus spongiae]|uniref:Uncharacterized protein n=1 Tax=Paenibacillus spongiae TaxID=2909671 RepID=A0ABY5SHD5_9BACL|nr:hypothetical protein [Paenibacillus spongiae]UVI33407.1 hypothetical protein L1F29_16885 [Paenibacillus spongiae]